MINQSSPEETRIKLEHLPSLTFYDERFFYEHVECAYRDIEHVDYTASVTKHSVNFIPTGTTYEASLVLHLSGNKTLQIKRERELHWGSEFCISET